MRQFLLIYSSRVSIETCLPVTVPPLLSSDWLTEAHSVLWLDLSWSLSTFFSVWLFLESSLASVCVPLFITIDHLRGFTFTSPMYIWQWSSTNGQHTRTTEDKAGESLTCSLRFVRLTASCLLWVAQCSFNCGLVTTAQWEHKPCLLLPSSAKRFVISISWTLNVKY